MSIVSNVGWWTSAVLSLFILAFPTRLFVLLFIHTFHPDTFMKIRTNELQSTRGLAALIDTDPVTGVESPHYEKFEEAPIIFYIMHLLPVYFWAIAMPLQFSASFRRRYPSWHRRIGTVTLGLSGLLIGISGFLMHVAGITYQTPDPVGTLAWLFSNLTVSTVLSLLFLYTTYKGYVTARAKKFNEHKRWMVRYASLGYSVVVQRVLFIFLIIVYPYEVENRTSRNIFGYLFALSVVLCIFAAELGLNLHSQSGKKTIKTM